MDGTNQSKQGNGLGLKSPSWSSVPSRDYVTWGKWLRISVSGFLPAAFSQSSTWLVVYKLDNKKELQRFPWQGCGY